MPNPATSSGKTETCDVLIMGGGLAGLCLSLQLKQTDPSIKILVLEKKEHPVPEAAHKVGESTVEIAGRYFAKVLGMEEHLEKYQLRKPGLRFYFHNPYTKDVADRTEYGFTKWPKIWTYQIDRGRFENALGEESLKRGNDFRSGVKITDIKLAAEDSDDNHVVTAEKDGVSFQVSCRFLVDASGRVGLLKKKLDLAQEVDHQVGAAWWRVTEPIDIDDLSDDPRWRGRVEPRMRWLATNHLMGPGYWFWLIPLAGGAEKGSISFGIVADNRLQPFDTFNTLEKALAWVDKNEPQAAKLVRKHQDKIIDFLTLRRFAYRCKRVMSPNRWALVGEAGTFSDPFLSPGSDTISFANNLTTDLVMADRSGMDKKSFAELAEGCNEYFFGLYDSIFSVYQNNYPLMGNTQVMAMKCHFDYYNYWGYFALMAYQNVATDIEFYLSVADFMQPIDVMYNQVQAMLRQWHELDQRPRKPKFFDQTSPDSLAYQFHAALDADLTHDQLREKLRENTQLVCSLAVAIFRFAVKSALPEHYDRVANRAINPWAVSMMPDRWEADGLFDPEKAVEVDPRVHKCVSRLFFELADEQPAAAAG